MIDIKRQQIAPLPQFFGEEKFFVNQYYNPYLTKLTMKLYPNLAEINKKSGCKLFLPLYNHNRIAIRQTLPLYKSSKFMFSLSWRQDIRNTFNLTHIGGNMSYSQANDLKVKMKVMTGISLLTQLSIHKEISLKNKRKIELFGMHSGFLEDNHSHFHTVGVGGHYQGLGVGLYQKIDGDLNIRTNYEYLIKNGVYLKIKSDTLTQNPQQTIIQAGIGYHWAKNISAWLKTVIQPQNIQNQTKNIGVQCQLKFKSESFVASVQYSQSKSIVYLGYKSPSFNFIFPILGVESPIPILLGLGLFIYGYFNRKKQQIKQESKKESERLQELRLISDKAGQVYRKQEQLNGLLIQQIYIGPKQTLQNFLQENNRTLALQRQQQYSENIFDTTVSFRFYVQKGQLKLPKGSKLDLLGCYYKYQQPENKIYIRYVKRGCEFEKFFNESDQIVL